MKITVRNRMLEYSCILFILIGFIGSKIVILQNWIQTTPSFLTPFMEQFVSNFSIHITSYLHVSEAIYYKLIHLFFIIFGDRSDLIIYFHIVIQVGILLVFYYAVRKFSGRITSVISLLGGAFLFSYYGTHVFYEPVVYCSYFLLFVIFLGSIKNTERRMKSIIHVIAMAFVMSTQAWFGVYGLYLLFFYGLVIFLNIKKERFLKLFVFYSVVTASVCTFLVFNPDIEIAFYFQELIHIFSGLSQETIQFLYVTHLNYYYIGAVVVLVCLLVTILLGERKKSIVFIMFGIGNFIYLLFNDLNPDYLIILGFIGAMIIGNTVQTIWESVINKRKTLNSTEPVLMPVEAAVKSEKPTKKEVNEEKIVEDRLVSIVKEPVEKINYIDNPLPVPKKHIPKQMDFAVDLTDSTKDFDLNILKGKDDFDL